MEWMSYNSRSPCQVALLLTKNRSLGLQWAQAHRSWTVRLEKCSLVWWILISAEATTWIHEPNLPYVSIPGWWRWCNSHGESFLAHFSVININQSSFKCYSLLEYCMSDWFHEHDSVLQWASQSLDLNTIKYLRDVVEQEICKKICNWKMCRNCVI